ncbi:MAG TPA: hypothetical protein PKC31_02440 [Candidatus Nanoperiomorbaceae bacterium]|nr:hypothetical protein [Candidatus Nanoperiomorbaceae bacterium]HMQ97021.1 hypothetical protein [Candidatus Nanoperiomorbaceae bacterium]HMR86297.1 hypothetical protein [Candidatus Nanoperiomorbaceae bacterium]HMU12079.1 hypothetical protein [Candidatus Nanoperiomorbaceae bacterium]
MSKLVILIGGAPTVGKSTIATLLADHLHLPWLSTDQTRDIMLAITSKKDYPDLHSDDDYDAVSFLNTFDTQEIVDREWKQGIEAWPGNKKLIEDDYTWQQGFIFEGVGILPELLSTLHADVDIRPIFLIDNDESRIRDVVFRRGLWDIADSYPHDVKEKEVAWAKLFGEKLEKSAVEHGYPVVHVKKNSVKDLDLVLNALNLH